ncbi:MAG: hypothetical protein SFU86_06925 [Pirellulaceae bacterium]|nr:hypothetical protein [Pirellulaceae bacterium]
MSTLSPDKPQPRRRWLRWVTQFSLRSLLLVTTVAAGVCWWFWAPKPRVEPLAGGQLQLRRHVRQEAGTNVIRVGSMVSGPSAVEAPIYTNIGGWQLNDEASDPLVSGRFRGGIPSGNWTTWYPDGRVAAQGTVAIGARTGVWRVWDESGTLRSEVTYRPTRERVPLPTPNALFWQGSLYAPGLNLETANRVVGAGFRAVRLGPARSWRANGQLEFEGAFDDDLRHGAWTSYDEAGRITEQGEYRRGLREGKWQIRDSSGELREMAFVAGRTKTEHAELLARLAAEMASGDLRRQLAAETLIAELGPAAIPALAPVLGGGSVAAQILVLRQLARFEPPPLELLPQIEPLAKHADSRLALRGMQLVYLLAPERRAELWPKIDAAQRAAKDPEVAAEILTQLCDVDSQRRQEIFLRLVERLTGNPIPQGPFVSGVYDPNTIMFVSGLNWAPLPRLKTDPLPLLVTCCREPNVSTRIFVLHVLEQMIERGPAERKGLADGGVELRWPIPAEVKGILEQAQFDPSPEVREIAAGIGKVSATAAELQRGYGPGFF